MNLMARDSKMTVLLQHAQIISFDYSRFDRHVSRQAQCFETDFFAEFSTRDSELRQLMAMQQGIVGQHVDGIYYAVHEGRCSGEANTSSGNFSINKGVVNIAMRDHPCWDDFVEGDDGVLGCTPPIDPQHLVRVAATFGFDLVVESSSEVTGHKFCGRLLVDDGGRLTSIADLERTLPKFHLSRLKGRSLLDRKGLARAKAQCYLATDVHTPILGPWCKLIDRVLSDVPAVFADAHLRHRMSLGSSPRPTSTFLRSAVEEAYGISVTRQVDFERCIERLDFIPDIHQLLWMDLVVKPGFMYF
jgi:hypothetical protein